MYIKKVPITVLKMAEYNPRKDLKPGDPEYEKLERSITRFGCVEPIVWNQRTGNVVGGHQRLKILIQHGESEVEVSVVDLDDPEEKALNIALNKISGEWDDEMLESIISELANLEDFDETLTGFDEEEIQELLDPEETVYFRDKLEGGVGGTLFDVFVIPPFSVFDTRQGYWQERKNYWIDSGIRSEIGREENLTYNKNMNLSSKVRGTSIFDPVICEISYRWFNIDGGSIIDPFAGGSVRGIMASLTGHSYLGIDLRKEQIDSNIENAKEMGAAEGIRWVCDNSLNVDRYAEDESYDMMFTCPPYFDLEVYSDDPEDISNMSYEDFTAVYSDILKATAKKVKHNRFAVIVISDVRDKMGYYRNLTGLTKSVMDSMGFQLYNEIIVLNTVGSGAWRCRGNMRNRKVVRIHQNALVFFKGNTKEIQETFHELKAEDEQLQEYEECSE